MKKFICLFVVTFILCCGFSTAFAGWDTCKGCHTDSGKPGPSKASMLKKFKTIDELVKAAMASTNPMMQSMKNETILKAAAKEMGLKESKSGKKDDKQAGKDTSKETKKDEVKKQIKSEEKTEKKETTAPKAEVDKKEEPKKKKKAIEGC